jgi:hypothetical protein
VEKAAVALNWVCQRLRGGGEGGHSETRKTAPREKGRGAFVPRLSRVTAHQRREAQFRLLGARSELNPDQHSPGCRSTRVGRI